MESNELFDMDSILKKIGGSTAVLKTLLNLFINDKNFALYEEALKNNNKEEAGKAVHAVKGVAGNLSLKALFNSSAVLNKALLDDTATEEMISDFNNVYSESITFVKGLIPTL